MEHRIVCNTCGHIFCYTDEDVRANRQSEILSGISSLGAAAGALSGNWVAARANQAQGQFEEGKIKDFNHCPKCNSISLKELSEQEYNLKKEKSSSNLSENSIKINPNASLDSLIRRSEIYIEDGEFSIANEYIESALDMEPENGYLYYLKMLVANSVKTDAELIQLKKDFTDDVYFKNIMRFNSPDELKNKLIDIQAKSTELREKDTLAFKESQYIAAKTVVENTDSTSTQLEFSLVTLNTLSDYKDSAALCNKIRERLQNLEKKRHEELKKKVRNCILALSAIVIVALIIIVGYKWQANEKIKKEQERIAAQIPIDYESGLNHFEQDKFQEAWALLSKCGNYEKSKYYRDACDWLIKIQNNESIPMNNYVSFYNSIVDNELVDVKEKLDSQFEVYEVFKLYLGHKYADKHKETIKINTNGNVVITYPDLDFTIPANINHNKNGFHIEYNDHIYSFTIGESGDYIYMDKPEGTIWYTRQD